MTNEAIKIAAVIVAAGKGERAGGKIAKQWQTLMGRRVIDWTIDAFQKHNRIKNIIVVTQEHDPRRASLAGVTHAPGGTNRAESVHNGLQVAKALGADAVMIHDAARPCVSPALLDRCVAGLRNQIGTAPGLVVTDALWLAEGNRVKAHHPRAGLMRAQTPQCFHLDTILVAHTQATGTELDDVEIAINAGVDVTIVPGDEHNIKITYPEDFDRAALYLELL